MSVLPEPSIIAKLQTLDPSAAEIILDRAERLQAQAHENVKSKSNWRALLSGAASVFGGGPRFYPSPQPSPGNQLQKDWQRAGDYLRQAISAYMREHNISEEDLALTAEEKKSLVVLDIS